MRLRSHLLLLSIATAAPVLVLAVVVAVVVVKQERDTVRDAARDRVVSVMTAIDAELRGSIATLGALAASRRLEIGDVEAFHAEAQRILSAHPDWLDYTLAAPDGMRIASSAVPPGHAQPAVVDRESFDLAVTIGEPVVGSLALGPDGKNWGIPLRMPVMRDGSVKYVVTAVLRPNAFADLLRAQRLPEGWVVAIADRDRRIISRVPPVPPGQEASESWRAELERSPQGWFRGRTIEGRETYTPYVTSTLSGWALGIAMPAEAVDAAAWRSLWLVLTMVLLASGIAVGLALLLGWRIAKPIASLASATDAIGRGERLPLPRLAAIDEIERLAGTLQKSMDAMREREERLRLALDAGRMGSWEWDVRTSRVSWSPELEAIHGLAPGTFDGSFEAYQRDIHPEDREAVQAAIAASLERDEHHVEYRIVRPDGSTRWVEGRGKVVRDPSGAPERVVGVCMDITERKHAEQALKEASRAKDEFLAMLSHELRNPLAALTTAAHVLKLARPGDAAAVKARAVVDRQTKHMTRLVGDLLDISRVAMGKVALERERFNLAEATGNLVNVWRASGRLERHGVSTAVKSVWIDADRARVEQVLSNLLDNAVKFTPAGRKINVSVEQQGDWAVLRVSDEGEGLTPGSAERMFELFVQGERGLDRGAGGLGVGLALVKRLTEMHGGTVSAESAGPGLGAAFTVKLPAVQPATTKAGAPESPPLVAPLRVLIVEDNDDARQMLHEALAFGGHEVREARDGASGLAAAAESRPDVALIDIGLPDLDGYEVARRLRAAPGGRRVGLIAITGYGQAEDQRRAYEAGFDAHLTKPVAPERLKQVMAGLQ